LLGERQGLRAERETPRKKRRKKKKKRRPKNRKMIEAAIRFGIKRKKPTNNGPERAQGEKGGALFCVPACAKEKDLIRGEGLPGIHHQPSERGTRTHLLYAVGRRKRGRDGIELRTAQKKGGEPVQNTGAPTLQGKKRPAKKKGKTKRTSLLRNAGSVESRRVGKRIAAQRGKKKRDTGDYHLRKGKEKKEKVTLLTQQKTKRKAKFLHNLSYEERNIPPPANVRGGNILYI